MKRCGACKQDLPFESFGKSSSRKDGYQNRCRTCRSEHGKRWYQNNQAVQYQRVKENQKRIDRWLYDYLSSNPCVDCGESRVPTLQFDHIDPTTKLFGLSGAGKAVGSLKAVQDEVKKCQVRCANCHSMRSAAQQGWYARFI